MKRMILQFKVVASGVSSFIERKIRWYCCIVYILGNFKNCKRYWCSRQWVEMRLITCTYAYTIFLTIILSLRQKNKVQFTLFILSNMFFYCLVCDLQAFNISQSKARCNADDTGASINDHHCIKNWVIVIFCETGSLLTKWWCITAGRMAAGNWVFWLWKLKVFSQSPQPPSHHRYSNSLVPVIMI